MACKIEYGCNIVGNFRLLGFATGSYNCTCSNCGLIFLGDKRSCQCLKCAIKLVEEKLFNDKCCLWCKCESYDYTNIAEDFWHGDFDMGQFLKAIGYSGVEKVKVMLNE